MARDRFYRTTLAPKLTLAIGKFESSDSKLEVHQLDTKGSRAMLVTIYEIAHRVIAFKRIALNSEIANIGPAVVALLHK